MKFSASTLVILLLMVALFDCHPPDHSGNAWSVHFFSGGGIGGGQRPILAIDSLGIATIPSYPLVSRNLSADDQRSILEMFDDFDELASAKFTPAHYWFDDYYVGIEFKSGTSTKTLLISGAELEGNPADPPSTQAKLKKIKLIDSTLQALANSIARNDAPWSGLQLEGFSLSKPVYGPGEPITMICRVGNRTDRERTLFFQHRTQFYFTIERQNPSPRGYHYPPYGVADSSAPTTFSIAPKTSGELRFSWDYAKDTGSRVVPATYTMTSLQLLGWQCTSPLRFEVADPTIPIGGLASFDTTRDKKNDVRCTFTLTVQNWTLKPVSLHFLQDQKILVRIIYPFTNVEIYKTTIAADGNSSDITLKPNETVSFSRMLEKGVREIEDESHMYGNLWSARVKLLSTEYDIEREVTVRFP